MKPTTFSHIAPNLKGLNTTEDKGAKRTFTLKSLIIIEFTLRVKE